MFLFIMSEKFHSNIMNKNIWRSKVKVSRTWEVGGVVSKCRQESHADTSLETGKRVRRTRGKYRDKGTWVRCNNIADKGQVNEGQVRPIKAGQTEAGSAERGLECTDYFREAVKSARLDSGRCPNASSHRWTQAQIA